MAFDVVWRFRTTLKGKVHMVRHFSSVIGFSAADCTAFRARDYKKASHYALI